MPEGKNREPMFILHNSCSDITSTSIVYGGLDQWLHVQLLPSALLLSQELLTGFPATYVYLWWYWEIFSVKPELKLAHRTVTAYHHTSSDQLQTSAAGARVQGYEYNM